MGTVCANPSAWSSPARGTQHQGSRLCSFTFPDLASGDCSGPSRAGSRFLRLAPSVPAPLSVKPLCIPPEQAENVTFFPSEVCGTTRPSQCSHRVCHCYSSQPSSGSFVLCLRNQGSPWVPVAKTGYVAAQPPTPGSTLCLAGHAEGVGETAVCWSPGPRAAYLEGS